MQRIEIEFFKPDCKEDVIELILNIQREEFNIKIDRKDQPDLENIENYYQKEKGNFWLAKVNNSIVGTISLLDIGNGNGALRKMFVKANFRGKELGVGQLLLENVFAWAQQMDFKYIYLGTTQKFVAAQRFYEKNNFEEIDKNALPIEFPVMSVDIRFYKYVIEKNSAR
jgi:N-acetylglutamate synthase-like GNAT family acetyltransferase